MKRTISVRLAATGAAAALAFTGLGLGAAFAADADGNNAAADASSIDPNVAKSLTIHKFTPSSVTKENDGRELSTEAKKELTDNGAKPINGIKFKIRKITNIDMTKNEGWKQAEKVADAFKANKTADTITGLSVCGADGAQACTLGTETEQATVDQGVTKFAGLEPGYYLVEENLAGSDEAAVKVVGDDSIKKDQIISAEPFLVSVPLTNPENKKEWLYDVHVYPKNSTAGIEKEVKDQNTPGAGNNQPGSQITYTIKTDIPAGVKELKNYTVIDPLNKQLEYLGTGKVIVATKDSDDKIAAVTLTEGAGNDYEVISHDLNTGETGTVVTLRFTETGRAKLISARDNNEAARVIWDLNANLKTTVGNAYVIPNTATLFPPNKPNDEWDPNSPTDTPPGTTTPPVLSKYGKVTITKKGSGDDAEKLNGAKFQLFLCNADGQILNYKEDAHTPLDKKQPGETNEQFLARVDAAKISVNNKTEWVSGTDGIAAQDGKIVIDGLQLNDWENDKSKSGVTGKVADPDWYCLVETEAPAKYELLPEPIKFQLLEGSNTAGPDQPATYNVEFDVKNVPSNGGFELPVTGGQGIALLVTAGGLLVAGSVAYTVAASRKRKQQA